MVTIMFSQPWYHHCQCQLPDNHHITVAFFLKQHQTLCFPDQRNYHFSSYGVTCKQSIYFQIILFGIYNPAVSGKKIDCTLNSKYSATAISFAIAYSMIRVVFQAAVCTMLWYLTAPLSLLLLITV